MPNGMRARIVENEMERERKTEKKNLLLCIFFLSSLSLRPNLVTHLFNTAWSRSREMEERKESEILLKLSLWICSYSNFFLCTLRSLVGVFFGSVNSHGSFRWLPNKTLQASLIRSVILLGWMGKWKERENVAIMGKKYSTREREKWWIDFSKLNN